MDATSALAKLYLKQNRLCDAGDLFAVTMTKYDDLLGFFHPKTIGSVWHLALMSAAKAEYEKAVTLIEVCLNGYKHTLGTNHRTTQICAHLVVQYRYYLRAIPDYAKVRISNRAIQANRDAYGLGESAPQWMREWQPVSDQALIQERLDRGETVYGYEMKDVDVDGLPFYRLNPVKEYNGQETAVNILQRH